MCYTSGGSEKKGQSEEIGGKNDMEVFGVQKNVELVCICNHQKYKFLEIWFGSTGSVWRKTSKYVAHIFCV